jgi:hypothetical protein
MTPHIDRPLVPHTLRRPGPVQPPPARGPDRRRSRRRALLDEHGILSVRVRPGQEAALIDVSASGALLESACRLLPGTAIELQIGIRGRRAPIRARVLRCAISDLAAAGPRYRAAVNFDRPLSWLVEAARPGYALPLDLLGQGLAEGAEATPHGR